MEAGIGEDTFMALPMQEYSKYGVQDIADKKKLFQLLQMLKREKNNPGSASAQPTPRVKTPPQQERDPPPPMRDEVDEEPPMRRADASPLPPPSAGGRFVVLLTESSQSR